MQRKNDTDTNWLVYADWLEESGREAQAHAVRDAVERTPEAGWCYEWRVGGVGGGFGVGGVGVIGGSGVGGVRRASARADARATLSDVLDKTSQIITRIVRASLASIASPPSNS